MADDARCPHCPDGHANPRSRPWGVYVGPERDGDGQPTTLHVGPSNGAHVAESDAEWLWNMIRGDSATAARIIDEILAPLRAQIGVAEYETSQATKRADKAEASNARVREIHAPDRIYQDCGHDGHPEDEAEDLIEVGADGSMVCADSPYITVCAECCIDNDEQTAHCIDHHDHSAGWICDTRTALDEPEANHD